MSERQGDKLDDLREKLAHYKALAQVGEEILHLMHDEGIICRDHYNPARGRPCPNPQRPWCIALQRWDDLVSKLLNEDNDDEEKGLDRY